MALAPTFLVLLAFVLHVISLWQLLGGRGCLIQPLHLRRAVRASEMPSQRVVLITGASSGVGQTTARLLSQRGYKVFGTSRNPASADGIPGVEMLSLDVRADASARGMRRYRCESERRSRRADQQRRLRASGALEELSSEEAKAQFETNFFGVVRMVNAVLPIMRRQKRGHIINVGSLAGRVRDSVPRHLLRQ